MGIFARTNNRASEALIVGFLFVEAGLEAIVMQIRCGFAKRIRVIANKGRYAHFGAKIDLAMLFPEALFLLRGPLLLVLLLQHHMEVGANLVKKLCIL